MPWWAMLELIQLLPFLSSFNGAWIPHARATPWEPRIEGRMRLKGPDSGKDQYQQQE
jgi:hypothetical protein